MVVPAKEMNTKLAVLGIAPSPMGANGAYMDEIVYFFKKFRIGTILIQQIRGSCSSTGRATMR